MSSCRTIPPCSSCSCAFRLESSIFGSCLYLCFLCFLALATAYVLHYSSKSILVFSTVCSLRCLVFLVLLWQAIFNRIFSLPCASTFCFLRIIAGLLCPLSFFVLTLLSSYFLFFGNKYFCCISFPDSAFVGSDLEDRQPEPGLEMRLDAECLVGRPCY